MLLPVETLPRRMRTNGESDPRSDSEIRSSRPDVHAPSRHQRDHPHGIGPVARMRSSRRPDGCRAGVSSPHRTVDRPEARGTGGPIRSTVFLPVGPRRTRQSTPIWTPISTEITHPIRYCPISPPPRCQPGTSVTPVRPPSRYPAAATPSSSRPCHRSTNGAVDGAGSRSAGSRPRCSTAGSIRGGAVRSCWPQSPRWPPASRRPASGCIARSRRRSPDHCWESLQRCRFRQRLRARPDPRPGRLPVLR